MQEGNYHCKNLKIILSNQKNHLVLEYNNYCNCLQGYLEYYNDISNKFKEQLNSQSLTNFLGSSSKKTETNISDNTENTIIIDDTENTIIIDNNENSEN